VMLDVSAALDTLCNWMSMCLLSTFLVAEAMASRSARRRPDMSGDRFSMTRFELYKSRHVQIPSGICGPWWLGMII